MYKGNHKKGEIEIVKENVVFENKFVRHFNDEVLFPNGNKGTYIRTESITPYGVTTLAIQDGKLLLINEFRHSERKWCWLTPTGGGEDELPPIDSALKELREETGYIANHCQPLLTTIQEGNHKVHIFIAKELEYLGTRHEPTECIRDAKFFSKEECRLLLIEGELNELTTLCVLAFLMLD